MVNAFNRTLEDLNHLKFEGYRIIEDYDTRHQFAQTAITRSFYISYNERIFIIGGHHYVTRTKICS